MFIGENVDVAASPTVTARGWAMWLKLFAVESDTTVAASPWLQNVFEVSWAERSALLTCTHMDNKVIEECFSLGVRFELWVSADKIETYLLPSLPLSLSFSK